MVAGSVAAGDAFVQQRGLQDVCDGAAAAAAASGVDLGRGGDVEAEPGAAASPTCERRGGLPRARPVRAAASHHRRLSADAPTLTLTCEQTEHIAFGAMFGKGDGVHHVVTSQRAGAAVLRHRPEASS